MNTQNLDYQTQFLNSLELFAVSSQNLDQQTLLEIFNIIQDVYGSSNNEYRKEREALLMTLRGPENWKKYLLHLFQIICFLNIPKKEIFERIAFEIQALTDKKANSNQLDFNFEELVTFLAANLYTLLNKDFPIKVYSFLAQTLRNLAKSELINKNSILFLLEQYITSFGSLNNYQSLGVSLLMKRLLENESFKTPEFERLEMYFQTGLKLAYLQLDHIQNNQLTSDIDILVANEILLCCSDLSLYMLDKLFSDYLKEKARGESNQSFNEPFYRMILFEKQSFFQTLIGFWEKILSLAIYENNIKLISLGTKVDIILNKAKRMVIKGLNILLQYVFTIKSIYEVQITEDEKKVFASYVQSFSDHLKFFLTQIHATVANKFSRNLSLSVEQNGIITETLSILKNMVDKYEFYDLFLENRTEVIMNIIVNLLLTTKTDLNYLEEDPRDFTFLEQDMAGEGESDNLKTNAAHFFSKYCEKIDGTLSWITELMINSINLSLDKPGDYNSLFEHKDSLFFSTADPLNRVETGFLCLILLIKHIVKREDLTERLDNFITSDLKLLFNINSNLVKCRICLFLKEMIPSLFQRNQNHFKEVLKYLFECLINFENLAVSYQALSALEFATNKENQYYRVMPILDDMLEYLEKVIDCAREEHYFDFIISLLNDYEEVIYQYGTRLVRCFCTRTWNEFQTLGEERTNIVIVKCLEAIRNMTASQDIMDNQFFDFEDDLQNLFSLLDGIHRIDFEDGLVFIATEVAKHVSMNTALFTILQRNLFKILEKNEYSFDMFFELFYHWCFNGHIFISNEFPELLVEMVRVCLKALEVFPFQRIRLEYKSFSMICLSLQIIIQCFGEDDFIPLMEEIIRVFHKTLQKIDLEIDGVACFRFLQTYFSLIFYCTHNTIVLLTDPKLLNLLIKMVPVYFLEFFRHDNLSRKTIALGLIAILFNRSSLNLDLNLMHHCFINIIQILNSARTNPKVSQFKEECNMEEISQSTPIFNIDIQDFKEDSITAASITLQDKELTEFIKRFEFPISMKDEFYSFSEIYKILKENHSDFINQLLSKFNPSALESLKTLLSSRCFSSNDLNKSEFRKNVSVKKKSNSNTGSFFSLSQFTANSQEVSLKNNSKMTYE